MILTAATTASGDGIPCREKGIEPRRKFSGKFNVRLTPDDHAAAVIAAAASGKSLNEWIVGTIREA
jgi:predicted HicB family RNase H-like nuclease